MKSICYTTPDKSMKDELLHKICMVSKTFAWSCVNKRRQLCNHVAAAHQTGMEQKRQPLFAFA